jgi:WD40 repeat protein
MRTCLVPIIFPLACVVGWQPQAHAQSVKPDDYVRAVRLSTDGKMLAEVNSDGSITVTMISAGHKIHLDGHKPVRPIALAFSPGKSILASGDTEGFIKLWDFSKSSAPSRTIKQPPGVWSLAFNQRGTRLAAGGDGSVQIWDASSGKEIQRYQAKGTTENLAFDPTDEWLVASAGHILNFWNLKKVQRLQRKVPTFEICSVVFSPDGRMVATGGGLLGNVVQLWKEDLGFSEIALGTLPHRIEALAFSPDGTKLAAASVNGTINLWQTSDGHVLWIAETQDYFAAIAFAQDGRTLISASGPNQKDQSVLRTWDSETGHQRSSAR